MQPITFTNYFNGRFTARYRGHELELTTEQVRAIACESLPLRSITISQWAPIEVGALEPLIRCGNLDCLIILALSHDSELRKDRLYYGAEDPVVQHPEATPSATPTIRLWDRALDRPTSPWIDLTAAQEEQLFQKSVGSSSGASSSASPPMPWQWAVGARYVCDCEQEIVSPNPKKNPKITLVERGEEGWTVKVGPTQKEGELTFEQIGQLIAREPVAMEGIDIEGEARFFQDGRRLTTAQIAARIGAEPEPTPKPTQRARDKQKAEAISRSIPWHWAPLALLVIGVGVLLWAKPKKA